MEAQNHKEKSPHALVAAVAEWIATFCYVGKAPKAPGTWGSLAALPFAWFVWSLPRPAAWTVVFAIFLIGVWAAHVVIRKTGVHDHQSIVIDEVVGILFTCSIASHIWWHYFAAFLLFRAFDIGKPWPIRWVDRRWKGGGGAMMDDVVAAMLATAVLWLILFFTYSGWALPWS